MIIPDRIDGLPITSSGDDAFAGCSSPTSVYFRADAPSFYASDMFATPASDSPPSSDPAAIYYLPGTTGWSTTFGYRPTALWFLPNPLILNYCPGFGVKTNRFGFIISWATNIPSWSKPARPWSLQCGLRSPRTPS